MFRCAAVYSRALVAQHNICMARYPHYLTLCHVVVGLTHASCITRDHESCVSFLLEFMYYSKHVSISIVKEACTKLKPLYHTMQQRRYLSCSSLVASALLIMKHHSVTPSCHHLSRPKSTVRTVSIDTVISTVSH